MNNDDNLQLHGYQEDLDYHFKDIDPFMSETTDDPLKEFRVPQEGGEGSSDTRETLEDKDEADGNALPFYDFI